MDIFIEPVKKIYLNNKKLILLNDIAEIHTVDIPAEKVKNIQIFKIPNVKYGVYKISAIDIIKAILSHFPNANITNIGEQEVLIQFEAEPKKESKLITATKVAIVVIILFFGTSTAIMSFHNDGEVPKVMKGYYKMFFNEENENPYVIEIPYSIGIAVGIMVFFNHFGNKALTMDPTPIEVEMSTYEEEVIKNQLSVASKKGEE